MLPISNNNITAGVPCEILNIHNFNILPEPGESGILPPSLVEAEKINFIQRSRWDALKSSIEKILTFLLLNYATILVGTKVLTYPFVLHKINN